MVVLLFTKNDVERHCVISIGTDDVSKAFVKNTDVCHRRLKKHSPDNSNDCLFPELSLVKKLLIHVLKEWKKYSPDTVIVTMILDFYTLPQSLCENQLVSFEIEKLLTDSNTDF